MLNKAFAAFTAILTGHFSPVMADIIETNKMSTVSDYLHQLPEEKNIYVFFNVTGTLYEPLITAADKKWRTYFAEKVKEVVPHPTLADAITNKVENQIVNKIPKKMVESETAALISSLQNQQVPVLGLSQKYLSTPFEADFAALTSKHIKSVGVNLEKTLSYLHLASNSQTTKEYTFVYGIIFTSDKPAGNALKAFFENNKISPSLVVLVNSMEDPLKNAQTVLKSIDIPFTGFHYTRTETQKGDFTPAIGTIQYLEFTNIGTVLSDKKAAQILKDNPNKDYEQMLKEKIQQLAAISKDSSN